MSDDIDWLNASSDFGLLRLCEELSALARPLDRAIAFAKPRKRRPPRRRRAARMAFG